MKKIIFTISCLTFFIPSFLFAQTGNHFGEQKFLSYNVEYLGIKGDTIVDATGITYKSYVFPESHEDKFLPERYWGTYALYFAGDVMSFRLTIRNEGRRTYRNLKIETFQEFLDIDGGQGQAIGDNNKHAWFIERLGPEEEIVLDGEFLIPTIGESGIDQTHLRISHWGLEDREEQPIERGEVVLEDFQAGLWCPF